MDYVSTSDDQLSDPSKKHQPKCKKMKKAPYVIEKSNVHFWIMFNFWWSAEQSKQKMLTKTQKNEKGPLSYQKIKCSFLDYLQLLMIRWVIRAKNIDQNAKKWKRPPKSLKIQMFIFGLSSTSDDQPSDPSKKCQPKQKKQKRPPKSSKNKSSFLDYIQLLMIGQAIWAKNIDWNAKKWKRPPKSSKNKMFVFNYIQLLMIGQAIWAKNVDQMQKIEKGPLSHWKMKCSFLD